MIVSSWRSVGIVTYWTRVGMCRQVGSREISTKVLIYATQYKVMLFPASAAHTAAAACRGRLRAASYFPNAGHNNLVTNNSPFEKAMFASAVERIADTALFQAGFALAVERMSWIRFCAVTGAGTQRTPV
ncbi:hypothetical protein A1507_02925 [Methylomonas koyamae]|uniref:Uncharacterized protein n=1 Tax=Methylomonas koyamae TaxID=702114 RepID=A0A177N5P3_9GAMM|nr:hypothetical protein A1507_02925 [Methylomonas koyamae]